MTSAVSGHLSPNKHQNGLKEEHLSQLPTEVTNVILDYLPSQDIGRVSLCAKKYKENTKDHYLEQAGKYLEILNGIRGKSPSSKGTETAENGVSSTHNTPIDRLIFYGKAFGKLPANNRPAAKHFFSVCANINKEDLCKKNLLYLLKPIPSETIARLPVHQIFTFLRAAPELRYKMTYKKINTFSPSQIIEFAHYFTSLDVPLDIFNNLDKKKISEFSPDHIIELLSRTNQVHVERGLVQGGVGEKIQLAVEIIEEEKKIREFSPDQIIKFVSAFPQDGDIQVKLCKIVLEETHQDFSVDQIIELVSAFGQGREFISKLCTLIPKETLQKFSADQITTLITPFLESEKNKTGNTNSKINSTQRAFEHVFSDITERFTQEEIITILKNLRDYQDRVFLAGQVFKNANRLSPIDIINIVNVFPNCNFYTSPHQLVTKHNLRSFDFEQFITLLKAVSDEYRIHWCRRAEKKINTFSPDERSTIQKLLPKEHKL